MRALQLAAFLNGKGKSLDTLQPYVIDASAEGLDISAYPILRVELDADEGEILLVLRYPDDPEGEKVFTTMREFLDVFLPMASDNPDCRVEASVPMNVGEFNRLDMPLTGLKGTESMVLFMVDGITYLENLGK
jgi:hypothetical protein